ncbi:uncharacterized protein LOC131630769 [Vicia villosa]|uniref:uncharacterized protein LOC131630769 n=1 Tax=Vicia villosa TaxID=3911 RepID=UPI00273B3621|nr:uncharacterized protein LOC131630769 [Vicia villosa]
MSNLTKFDFGALDISGKNYLTWALDAQIHLSAEGHGDTIKEGNKSSDQQKAKAMIFLRRHLHEDLKNEYLTVTDPHVLWKNLKDRYDHQKTVILPKARYEWMHLRLQDFKSVSDYNSAMFRITSKLILCGEKVTDEDMLEKTFSTFHASNVLLQQQYREKGFNKYSDLISCLLVAEQNNELLIKSVSDYNSAMFRITSKLILCGEKVTDEDMLEKTFSTFHASNVLLQQQYREKGFNKYSDLISCLLVAEQNNELLMKNHEARPTDTSPFPEVNVARHDHYRKNYGRGRACARGRGRKYAHGLGFDRGHNINHKNTYFHPKWKNIQKNEKEGQSSKTNENTCYRCGGKGH